MFEKGVKYWKRRTDLKHTPETLEQAAIKYFQWVDENPIIEQKAMVSGGEAILFPVPKARPYTVSGYCLFSGIGHRYFNELSHKPEFKEVCEWIKEACYAQKFDGAAVGIFNHFIIARDLGLTDKKEVQAVLEHQPVKEISAQAKLDLDRFLQSEVRI